MQDAIIIVMSEESYNLCKSCGHPKEYQQYPLCRYCYFRNQHGTMKMVVLKILEDNYHIRKLSLQDMMDELNKFEYIGYPMRKQDMKKILLRLKIGRLISVSKDKHKKPMIKVMFKGVEIRRRMSGKRKFYYMIRKNGIKILAAYKKRWKMGFTVRSSTSSEKKMPHFRMTTDFKERAGSIRQRLRDKESDHDLYTYIFPQRQNKQEEKKGMLISPKYPKKKRKKQCQITPPI